MSTIWATSVGSLKLIRTIRLTVFGFKKPRLYWLGSEWTLYRSNITKNGWMLTNGARTPRSFSMTMRRCDRDNPSGPKLLWLDLLITSLCTGVCGRSTSDIIPSGSETAVKLWTHSEERMREMRYSAASFTI